MSQHIFLLWVFHQWLKKCKSHFLSYTQASNRPDSPTDCSLPTLVSSNFLLTHIGGRPTGDTACLRSHSEGQDHFLSPDQTWSFHFIFKKEEREISLMETHSRCWIVEHLKRWLREYTCTSQDTFVTVDIPQTMQALIQWGKYSCVCKYCYRPRTRNLTKTAASTPCKPFSREKVVKQWCQEATKGDSAPKQTPRFAPWK